MPARCLWTLLPLAAALGACGARVEHADDPADAAPARNQLTLITDGAYGVDLATAQATCRHLVDDQVLTVRFRQPDGPDAGLQVSLTVSGRLAAGDVLAAGDAGGRTFDVRLATPSGAIYRFASAAPGAAAGSLTMVQASPFGVSGRLQLRGVPAAPGTGGAGAVDLRGSFSCARWD